MLEGIVLHVRALSQTRRKEDYKGLHSCDCAIIQQERRAIKTTLEIPHRPKRTAKQWSTLECCTIPVPSILVVRRIVRRNGLLKLTVGQI